MTRFRLLWSVLLTILLCCGVESLTAKPKQKKVYMFGFSASFTDSLVFMTDIQLIDSAFVDDKTKFLEGRSLYAGQFRYYVENSQQIPNTTCVVFFNEKKKNIESEYMDLRKKYEKDKGLILKVLNSSQFKFRSEQYVEPVKENN